MLPVKGNYHQEATFGEPYREDVLNTFPVLRNPPYNGVTIGWEWNNLEDPTIYSCVPGTITYVGQDQFGANIVWEDTVYNLRLLYAHLSGFKVKVGDQVGWQTPIGIAGQSGMATGIHLALQAKDVGGNWVDPQPVLALQPPPPPEPPTPQPSPQDQLDQARTQLDQAKNQLDTANQQLTDKDKTIAVLQGEVANEQTAHQAFSDKAKEASLQVDQLTADNAKLKNQLANCNPQPTFWSILRDLLRWKKK